MSTTNKAAIPNPALKPFEALIGEWKTSGTHPMVPDTVLTGHATVEWVEGGAFLVIHSEIFFKDFPETVSFFASDDALGKLYMLSFDERKVSRKHDVTFEDNVLKWWRNAPGFSQRYTLTFTNDGNTIIGKGELSTDDLNWEKDLDLTYTRIVKPGN